LIVVNKLIVNYLQAKIMPFALLLYTFLIPNSR